VIAKSSGLVDDCFPALVIMASTEDILCMSALGIFICKEGGLDELRPLLSILVGACILTAKPLPLADVCMSLIATFDEEDLISIGNRICLLLFTSIDFSLYI
jgi:hypothetical protein